MSDKKAVVDPRPAAMAGNRMLPESSLTAAAPLQADQRWPSLALTSQVDQRAPSATQPTDAGDPSTMDLESDITLVFSDDLSEMHELDAASFAHQAPAPNTAPQAAEPPVSARPDHEAAIRTSTIGRPPEPPIETSIVGRPEDAQIETSQSGRPQNPPAGVPPTSPQKSQEREAAPIAPSRRLQPQTELDERGRYRHTVRLEPKTEQKLRALAEILDVDMNTAIALSIAANYHRLTKPGKD